ncbi:MAG: aminomethyl-transferring glycine dehydrogenase [Microcoleus sp. PH2017_29_MFU_D_A]|uniref:aminomethyl-transferring glycine dehydrogenase n=1 Tax=unclassified Microcoleus TaxID=2642155 RepID=UPI001DBC7B0D|nr:MULTISPECIES: aminomethyl-transferring glycine dehydrogenase [unclassified Microcoleus]MCC3457693.1 aminomethyl-transferring glycine dehydrogenase [Microcoleus sp. PH2017_08_TRC_O_A]MCC3588365.1 aminomethyl-transferring glycine dehydrogenase [Microcoleus sp. PH2017_30_WIL_O_A]MCC3602540.1 aminomethyl-transferring glycine dehydrogenase [Microcoleus sp. PH2017_29_MFU_D_A]MCC3633694.1 aminomethyl-transferring glycine dehydrogenase [Microcoleus sp. PH2017_37_MFU_D_B]
MVLYSPQIEPNQQQNLSPIDGFAGRHIGPTPSEIQQMLDVLGISSLDELIDKTIPAAIRMNQPLQLPAAKSEYAALAELKEIAAKNHVFRSYIGTGYHNCITPPVIQRNILENPGWYTAYTPYQAEIAQGRLEALLNFQTMIIELTGLEIANASLLDEATAAAEAMAVSYGANKNKAKAFFVSQDCHPQTIEVVQTRAKPLGIEVIVGDHQSFECDRTIFGALLQYPATDGAIYDYSDFIRSAHQAGALVTVAADILSLCVLTPPGEFGADIAVGSTQRFGVPMGFGGPHAAYFATREEFKRQVPGRIVGVSKDANGKSALRLALQTREQHIRREKATSNICTAQVLLAVMASMYAVYHGPSGLQAIAEQVRSLTAILASGLASFGYKIGDRPFFDTLRVELGDKPLSEVLQAAQNRHINLRVFDETTVGITLDETVTAGDVKELWKIFAREKDYIRGDGENSLSVPLNADAFTSYMMLPEFCDRTTSYLTHPVFNSYHSETELLRYMHRLEAKDLSLNTSMIPLGSCTMKLNATAEMVPVTWAEFGNIHPFAPRNQTRGYQMMFVQLEQWLAEITGFAGISLQPNAGSQGEYAGLLVIHQYHEHRGESHRNICLIPQSAHGTNPASAVMAGMKVVAVECDSQGNIDVADLQKKADKHKNELAALMVTYPSTHGVFESEIKEICQIVHNCGGQVYMDGANMNAQVGLCRPGDFGADVCHLNLHKTFCIPHGGGGPGMGPIGVMSHLVEFLPSTDTELRTYPPQPPLAKGGSKIESSLGKGGGEISQSVGAVSAAPWGSASILTISWMYIRMMGGVGLTEATKVAILNANYMAQRLESYYPVLYKGKSGLVAHECILDLRLLKKTAGIEVDDIAKRLMDYGYHAPTVSWPVAGTVMVEPTESESKQELDRFCDAMIAIRGEIAEIENGNVDAQNNVLKNAPHTAESLMVDEWNHPYTRAEAAYPTPWTREYKFWPAVGRIDNAFGDRNFVCSCLPMEAYT